MRPLFICLAAKHCPEPAGMLLLAVSTVYLGRGKNRPAFVRAVFERLDIQRQASGKRVLIKPNIVSAEPYPTTTHPEVLETCIRLLLPIARRVIVADGAAPDAGDSATIIAGHPLKQACQNLGVTITDLFAGGTRLIQAGSLELEVSPMAFEADFILSLPVLKSHSICGLTGALKNHIGFLSPDEKRRLHYKRDVNRVIAELNQVIQADLYIVDAVQTLIITNEVRHGGQPAELGFMLAGTDPVSLDVAGLELLKRVEPRLVGKQADDIPHIRNSIGLGIGEPVYELVELDY